MSEKRQDNKGHVLRNGECQRKDGLYQSDIGVTLNTYTHVDFDNVKKEVKSLEKAVL